MSTFALLQMDASGVTPAWVRAAMLLGEIPSEDGVWTRYGVFIGMHFLEVLTDEDTLTIKVVSLRKWDMP